MRPSPTHDRLKIEALIANPLFMELAESFAAPAYDLRIHAKRREYPDWVFAFWLVAISVYGSAKNVERQLHDGSLWLFVLECMERHWGYKKTVRRRDHPYLDEAPERHQWTYFKSRYIVGNKRARHLEMLLRRSGALSSRVLGLCNGSVAYSLTSPDPRNVNFADAKTIKRLNKLVPQKQYQHGGGPKAGSMQVVIVGCSGPREHLRVVLGIEPVVKRGSEMTVTEHLVDELLRLGLEPHVLLYDGAMKGVHILHYLRLGIAAVSPLAKGAHGVVRDHPLGPHRVHQGDGSRTMINLFAKEGAPGAFYTDHTGANQWVALSYRRVRQPRRTQRYAWYLICDLPPALGGGYVRVRVDLDKTRAENLRLFPRSDPQYPLYYKRAQIESFNRGLDDTLYLRRAHSASAEGQRADCVGWGFLINSIALFLHGPKNLRGQKGLDALKASGQLPP